MARGLATAVLIVLLSGAVAHADQTTILVSVAYDGARGDSASGGPSVSADARLVVFSSNSTNLVADDTNGATDVFVRDVEAATTERVSVSSSGAEAQGASYACIDGISSDGRFVAFSSGASNLVEGDTNGTLDVFVRDRVAGTTERVSISSSGEEGNNFSSLCAISAEGRFVAFQSAASNLVPDDTNRFTDVFVHDRVTGTTERVTVSSSEAESNGGGRWPTISANGRFVAFHSRATNLVDNDTNGAADVFVRDRQAGETRRVSVSSLGVQGDHDSFAPSISGEGRIVAFHSRATTLVPADANGPIQDVFVHDLVTSETVLVSVSSEGRQAQGPPLRADSHLPSTAQDGRFVAFVSNGSLSTEDTNLNADVYVHDLYTGRTDLVRLGPPDGSGTAPAPSADGRWVAFVSDDGGNPDRPVLERFDVFLQDRGEDAIGKCPGPHEPDGPVSGPLHERIEPTAGPAAPVVRTVNCELIAANGL